MNVLSASLSGLFDECVGACATSFFSCRDELGETLATLIFAQRATSVTTEARVTVVPDLEGRCQDLQQQLDSQREKLIEITLAKAAADERLETAQDELAQLHKEKNASDARVQTMVEACDILQVVVVAVAEICLGRATVVGVDLRKGVGNDDVGARCSCVHLFGCFRVEIFRIQAPLNGSRKVVVRGDKTKVTIFVLSYFWTEV